MKKRKLRVYFLVFVFFVLLGQRGGNGIFNNVLATNLIHISDVISTSRPGVGANHTITFTVIETISAQDRIVIAFPSNFNLPLDLDYTDLDFVINGVEKNLSDSQTAILSGVEIASSVITIILADDLTIFSSDEAMIRIGRHAVWQTQGERQIINPEEAGNYKINIQTFDASLKLLDKAEVIIVVLEGVNVGAGVVVPPPSTIGPQPAPLPLPLPAPPEAPKTDTGIVVISPDLGGETSITNIDSSWANVSLEPGAVSQSTEIKIIPLLKSVVIPIASLPENLNVVGNFIYSLSAISEKISVTKFFRSVTLTIYYTDAQVKDFKEETLKIYRWSPAIKKWVSLPSSQVDLEQNIVTAKTVYFSLFAVIGEPLLPRLRPSDFNGDLKVDLVDFSILLYNWGAPKDSKTDINQDGLVDLIDFSILLYWWTG